MTKTLLLVLILFSAGATVAEDIAALTIGPNNYLGANSTHDEISTNGLGIGLLVPVNFERPVHLKIKAAFHDVDADKIEASDPSYVLLSNEVLIGLKWIENGKLDILPQAGLGFVAERYRMSKGNGRSHGDFFIDLSCRFDVALAHFNIGALINFERDFNIGYGSFLSPNRLNVALVLSK